MEKEFEKIYEWTNEKIAEEKTRLKEYKTDIRQSEGLIVGIIMVCLVIAFITNEIMAKQIFATVAAMMFIFCTFYTFKGERRIIEKQNKFSELALSELATHIKDGFVYEKDEEMSGSYYRKSGFNRIYKELDSKGIISGTRNNNEIFISNIVVRNQTRELFRGIFAYGTLKKEFNEIDVMHVNSKNNKKEKYAIPYQDLYMYSEDIKAARNVLTDKILSKVAEFKRETKVKFEFMINKNLIFFRFFDDRTLNKPIANDMQTKEYLYKYYKIIQFVSDFMTDIESN